MNRNEFTDRLNYCRRELESLQAVQMNCMSCASFETDAKACKRFGPVPADFIAAGCADWYWYDIPF